MRSKLRADSSSRAPHLRLSWPARALSSIRVSWAEPPPKVEEKVSSPLVAMDALLDTKGLQ
jgi:hypothetical protein